MAIVYFVTFLSLFGYGLAVPPSICFDNFNWDDCGRPPVHVLYYYKPGSRCEVGVWRGCYPNQNMFKDEYECVNTCIFIKRAAPEDYHQSMKGDNEVLSDETYSNETHVTSETTTESEITTNLTTLAEGNDTLTTSVPDDNANGTDTTVSDNSGNSTTPDAQNGTMTTVSGNATSAAGNSTN